eukprot:5292692-Prymnesium_polylepis.1
MPRTASASWYAAQAGSSCSSPRTTVDGVESDAPSLAACVTGAARAARTAWAEALSSSRVTAPSGADAAASPRAEEHSGRAAAPLSA